MFLDPQQPKFGFKLEVQYMCMYNYVNVYVRTCVTVCIKCPGAHGILMLWPHVHIASPLCMLGYMHVMCACACACVRACVCVHAHM